MNITIDAENKLNNRGLSTNSIVQFTYDSDECCPLCKKYGEAEHLYAMLYTYKNKDVCVIINRCRVCNQIYINTYDTQFISSNRYKNYRLISSEPKKIEDFVFEKVITDLSPDFVEIYNQSHAAEEMKLNHIAGMGYRKAVEFLVKDFAISEKPEDSDKIKSMLLSNCINNYIDDTRIKNLALKSAWIGNDESHYTKKHSDRDITDLKRFIHAMVYFIGMYFIEKDAETISPA